MLRSYSLSFFVSQNFCSGVKLNLYTAAAEQNKNAEFEGLRIHGLLTDLRTFYFYSFDPIEMRFAFDETLQADASRDAFIGDMIHGM